MTARRWHSFGTDVAESRIVGIHPAIRGLVEAIPPADSPWSEDEQEEWLEAARHVFRVVYKKPTIKATS